MALAIVREKELGSITNLYVTPGDAHRISALASSFPTSPWRMVNFAVMFLMALFVFRVPLKGSFPDAAARRAALRHDDDRLRHADLCVYPHPDCRTVRHRHSDLSAGNAVCRHADAGLFACRAWRDHGPLFPMTYFLPISVGTFTKGLGFCGPRVQPGRTGGLHSGADAV